MSPTPSLNYPYILLVHHQASAHLEAVKEHGAGCGLNRQAYFKMQNVLIDDR